MEQADIVIIGGGIAGTALAHALDHDGDVVLLEAGDQLGAHATGRSAALYSETYGTLPVRALTVASGPFLRHPPPGFTDGPLLSPRPVLHIARADQMDDMTRALIGMQALVPSINPLTGPECRTLAPLLREAHIAAGILEPNACDINVERLRQAYRDGAQRRGARIVTRAPVTALSRENGLWQVESPAGQWQARVVVNAAGARAGQVAALAGLPAIGLQPMRRTVSLIDPPAGMDIGRMPFILDIAGAFFLKPEGGALLFSSADNTPVEPGETLPDEQAAALAIQRVQQACGLQIQGPGRSWAVLRSFVADRNPVIGFDPAAEGFFWLAALGGSAVQTAPSLSAFAAGLLRGERTADRLTGLGFTDTMVSPARLR